MSLLTAPLEVLSDAARVPLFWVLFGTFFICVLSTNGLIQTHFVTLCGDYVLTAVSAARPRTAARRWRAATVVM